MNQHSDISAARPALRIDHLHAQDLSADDAVHWQAFLAQRPELEGPYFDMRYVKAIGASVPHACVARFRHGDRIVGYFPYQIRSGALQPLGAPLSDYHGMIAAPGFDMPFAELLAATGAKRLEFQGWVGPMCGAAKSLSLRRRQADTRLGFEHWWQTRNAGHHKFFKNIGRCERNVEKDFGGFAFSWECVTPDVLDWVIDLKRQQYRKTGMHDVFDCGWTYAMLSALATSDDQDFGLRAGVFRHAGRIVAAEIALSDGQHVHLWFPAYDPAYYRYSLGILLTVAIIRHLAPLGVKSFDFGTGGEDYKSPLTTEAGECLEGNLKYAPRLGSQMLDMTAKALPIGRPEFDRTRLSLKRRVNIIRATETGLKGWARALSGLMRRALLRVKPHSAA
ncbi:GNAT family N-acetyltransferase [Asticcacaulis sp. EMRT-3]|uniref:GNAT family N-acetyltransferase n=1 Tax=Asticcacaulis sp. EMRT-3 TaxID=3040349 RepID=UPI0024AF718B|nr:GNAT family N-acetyltransferase [Asticcacaulis sp. EMRT-3]MDI7775147.1 GNAT family N-acetyltransferase [Asticcacaulis sp. EMRT-3]